MKGCQRWRREVTRIMNQPVPDELISAYFDGEATPEERRRVEQMLESSTEFRQLLDDTSKLSALLHSFPREAAPLNLAGNVQRRIENTRLQVAKAAAPKPRRYLREWTAAAVGSTLTLAALLLCVSFQPLQNESARPELAYHKPLVENRLTETGMASTADKSSPVLPASPAPGSSALLAVRDHDDAKMTAVTATSSPPAAGTKVISLTEQALDATAVTNPNTNFFNFKLGLHDMLAVNGAFASNSENALKLPSNEDFLQHLKRGDIVLVADPVNTVVVVQFTVVDIDKDAMGIELLLQRSLHSAADLAALDVEDLRKLKDVSVHRLKKSDSATDDMVVMYVEAPSDRLASALAYSKEHPDLYPQFVQQMPIEFPSAEIASAVEAKQANTAGTVALDGAKDTNAAGSSDKEVASSAPVVDEAQRVVESFAYQNGLVIDSSATAEAETRQRALREQLIDAAVIGRRSPQPARAKVANSNGDPVGENESRSDKYVPPRSFVVKPQKAGGQQAVPVQRNLSRGQQVPPNNANGLPAEQSRQQKPAQTNTDNRESKMLRMLFLLRQDQTTNVP